MKTSQQLAADITAAATRTGEKLAGLKRFFKTGKGEYAEGDEFVGTTVPDIRKVCKKYSDLPLAEITKSLHNPIHEVRLAAAIIMTQQAKKADEPHKKSLYDTYLRNTKHINNWDIVDVSCPAVVGRYLLNKPRAELYGLARSKSIWERRIAIISTFAFTDTGDDTDTYKIATILLNDPHDLVQKAVGWALREAGKRCSRERLLVFLDQHAKTMPRTTLRYAIEHLSAEQRQHYLQACKT